MRSQLLPRKDFQKIYHKTLIASVNIYRVIATLENICRVNVTFKNIYREDSYRERLIFLIVRIVRIKNVYCNNSILRMIYQKNSLFPFLHS